jgi:hypothetical protein
MKKRQVIIMHILLFPTAYCIASYIVFFIINIIPRYIDPPVRPVDYSEECFLLSEWENIECKNVFVFPLTGRSYLCRAENTFKEPNDSTPEEVYEGIKKYYDRSLSGAGAGWFPNDGYQDCSYLFAKYKDNKLTWTNYELFHYRRRGYWETDEPLMKDLLCIGVYYDQENLNYEVYMLTMRPSISNELFYGLCLL